MPDDNKPTGDGYNHPYLPSPIVGTVDPRIRSTTDRIHGAIAPPLPGFGAGMRNEASAALQRQSFYDQLSANESRAGMQGAIQDSLNANNGPSMAQLQQQQALESNARAFGASRGNAGFQAGLGQLAQAGAGVAGDAGRARMAEMYGNLDAAAGGTNAMRAQDIQQAQGLAKTQLGQKQRNLQRYQGAAQLGSNSAENDRQANIEGLRLYQGGFSDQDKKNQQDLERALNFVGTVTSTIANLALA